MADFRIPQLRHGRLSSLLSDPSVMDGYVDPEPQQQGLLDPAKDAIGPPSVLGGLLSLDPTDYLGPQTLGKLAAGLKGLLAGGAMMGGIKSVGKQGPYAAAHETARKNAVEMLGLPENNTAMDRAKALGFDVDGFHGMPTPLRGTSFDRSMTAKNDYGAIGQGVYIDPSKDASYANAITDLLGNLLGSNVIPVKVRSGSMMDASELPAIYSAERSKAVTEGLRQRGVDSVMSFVNGNPNEMMVIDPSNIRSRFAAFDPARRHEADLLGRATPEMLGLTTLGSLLGLEAMRRNQE